MLDFIREAKVLAVHLNFTKAAQELCMSQSTLSRHMSDLEMMLGFPLFDKVPVRLTPAGSHLLENVGVILDELDALVSESKELAAVQSHSISVALLAENSAVGRMAFNAFALLKESLPLVDLEICDNRDCTILEAVEKSIADVGVVFNEPDENDELAVEWLYDEHYVVWVHEDSDIGDEVETLRCLDGYMLLSSTNRRLDDWTQCILSVCGKAGLSPKVITRNADTFPGLLASLKRDEFLCLTRSETGAGQFNSHLRKIEITGGESDVFPVYLVYRKRSDNPVLPHFVALCRQAIERILQ